MSVIARKPGQYAAERYERGVRSYRGRLYRYAARFIVIAVAVELAIALVLRNTIGWAMFAFVIGFLLGMVVAMREALPDHVRRWRDGTWGEQQTATRAQYRERGGDGGWVQAAVVIWGDFAQGLVEDGKLVFLDGEQLVEWLRKRA